MNPDNQNGELPEPCDLGLVNPLNRDVEFDQLEEHPLLARREGVGLSLAEAEDAPNNQNCGTTPLELALVWGFVGIPLLWGIYGTLVNAMKLFQ
jgi:hypothetical protein